MSDKTAVVCDLGGTKLALAEVDQGGLVISKQEESVRGLDPPEIMELVIQRFVDMVAERPKASVCGVAAAGLVNAKSGRYRYPTSSGATSVSKLQFTDFPLAERISAETGLPTFIENDGDAAALAEWKVGAAKGYQQVVVLTIGTGVGTGVIIHGELVRRRWSGPQMGGLVARIGQQEYVMGQVASGTGIELWTKELIRLNPHSSLTQHFSGIPITGEQVTALATAGDDLARLAVYQVSELVGELVVDAINVFDPEIVVLGGGAIGALDFSVIRKAHQDQLLPPGEEVPLVELAHHGVNAGLVGAAMAGFSGLGRAT